MRSIWTFDSGQYDVECHKANKGSSKFVAFLGPSAPSSLFPGHQTTYACADNFDSCFTSEPLYEKGIRDFDAGPVPWPRVPDNDGLEDCRPESQKRHDPFVSTYMQTYLYVYDMCICISVYIYIYTCVYMSVYMYKYFYIYRLRERERERERAVPTS